MTTGSRSVDARKYGSYISASPCEEDAVNVREPASDAPVRTLMAESSLSTSLTVLSITPSAAKSARYSTSGVCGVMGYAAMMPGRQSAAAIAAALLPLRTCTSLMLHSSFSATIAMACCLHSCAQMPQPLQKS